MSTQFRLASVVLSMILFCHGSSGQHIVLRSSHLLDKIRGAWVGKAYGVTFGAPTEFVAQGRIIEDSLDVSPNALELLPKQDDLFVNLVLLRVVASEGLDAGISSFAAAFAEGDFRLWHANGQSRQNILDGIPPELAGHAKFNPHADDIDFQISADFIGLLSPGLPRAAQQMAARVGYLMSRGDGTLGGVFVSTLYASALVQDDVRTVVEEGLRTLPPESRYAAIIRDVLAWYDENPADWRATWQKIESKWNADRCPWGALGKFNISASLNGAYMVVGLLFGGGQFHRTVEIATRCGQDSDCNPATAAGILGALKGYEQMPDDMKRMIAPWLSKPFMYSHYSIDSASIACLRLAKENLLRNGSGVAEDSIVVQPQQFAPCLAPEPSMEQLEPTGRYEVSDSRLRWVGSWRAVADPEEPMMASNTPGDYLEVSFEGTAIYVQGCLASNQGILEYSVDGPVNGKRDMYTLPKWKTAKQATAVWLTNLSEGPHLLRIKVMGEKRAESSGVGVSLGRVVSYRGTVVEPDPR